MKAKKQAVYESMNSFIIFAPEKERGKSEDREKIRRDTDKNIYRKRGRGKKRERKSWKKCQETNKQVQIFSLFKYSGKSAKIRRTKLAINELTACMTTPPCRIFLPWISAPLARLVAFIYSTMYIKYSTVFFSQIYFLCTQSYLHLKYFSRIKISKKL